MVRVERNLVPKRSKKDSHRVFHDWFVVALRPRLWIQCLGHPDALDEPFAELVGGTFYTLGMTEQDGVGYRAVSLDLL